MHFAIGKKVRAVSRMLYSTSRRAQQARHVRHHERDRRDTQLSLFVMCIELWSQ